MINLFQIPPQDQSILFLSQIFGAVGTILPTTAPSVIGTMFKVLNTMALSIGALIVVYVTIVGMLATAHEGEFLGKKWSGLWVPIRTTLGIAALFPMPSGYSAIQILAMWIIVQGIGAADLMWTTALKYKAVMGTPYSSTNAKPVSSGLLGQSMDQLFQGLVCQATAKATYPEVKASPNDAVAYLCGSPKQVPSFCKKSQSDMLNINADNKDITQYEMGPNGSCGRIEFCNLKELCEGNAEASNSPGCAACKAQRKALQLIVTTLGGVAAKFVEIDNQYLQFYSSNYPTTGLQVAKPAEPAQWIKDYCESVGLSGKECTAKKDVFNSYSSAISSANASSANNTTVEKLYSKFPLKDYLQGIDFIDSANSAYSSAISSAVTSSQVESVQLENWQAQASQAGWIYAASYYFDLIQQGKSALAAVNLVFNAPQINSNKEIYPSGAMGPNSTGGYPLRNNATAAKALMTANATQYTGVRSFSSPEIDSALFKTSSGVLSSFVDLMTKQTADERHPILRISLFGYHMMIAAQSLLAVMFLVLLAAGFIGGTQSFLFAGYGFTAPPWLEALKAGFGFLSPFIILFIVALFTLGALLAIYVPLIPFLIFVMGAIGWILATIEAMVAAPFVALGVLGPGGQHEVLGKAEPAVMLIFNVFLRPSLMIFGLLAAIVVCIPVVTMINTGFLYLSNQIISDKGLAESMVFISAYTMVIVVAINKVFSLIYVIPERVLTWIGGPAVQYGEGEAVGQVKHGVEASAGTMAGGGREGAATVSSGATTIRQARKARDDKPPVDMSAASTAQSEAGAPAQGAANAPAQGKAGATQSKPENPPENSNK